MRWRNMNGNIVGVAIGVVLWLITVKFMDKIVEHPPLQPSLIQPVHERSIDPNHLIHIVLTCDSTHANGAVGVINSSLHNTFTPELFRFHVVSESQELVELNRVLQKALPTAAIELHAHDRQIDAAVHDSSRPDLSSPIVYARFFFVELFPKLHRVIYLDVDVVVLGDLKLLWDEDMEKKPVGAVKRCRTRFQRQFFYSEANKQRLRKFSEKECVFNNGVLVYDLDAWRLHAKAQTDPNLTYAGQLSTWTSQNSIQPLYALGSQPPFNLVFYRNYFELDASWNVMDAGEPVIHPTISEVRAANVLHWNGNQKPWDTTTSVLYSGYYTRYVPNHYTISKSDLFTLVIVTMGKQKSTLLEVIEHVSESGFMHEAILVWNDLQSPCPIDVIDHFKHRNIKVICLKQAKNEMQNRLLVADYIATEGVLHHDDDAMIRQQDMLLAFRVWQRHRAMIVGFQPRVIRRRHWDKEWEYSFHLTEGHYSLVIGKFFFISKELMRVYASNAPLVALNEGKFCEDISINFVAAVHDGVMVVESDHWELKKPSDTGLSTRIDTHKWKSYRAECIPMLQDYLLSSGSNITLETFPKQTKVVVGLTAEFNQLVYRDVIPTESICSNTEGVKPCRMPNCTEAHGVLPCWGPDLNLENKT
eukprot:m.91368 g.91368  ORF g.91368 m.91368 type:complete len:644 (+) comp26461_c0_seq1:156-2087(+)